MRVRWLIGLLVLAVGLPAAAQNVAPDTFPPELAPESEAADPGFVRLPNPAFPSPRVHSVPIDRGPKIERDDLAPYFTGKLAAAKAAFDRGEYNKARALLDGTDDSSAVRFLRALAALRAGDFVFAGAELENLAETYTPLRDRCLVHAGWAYEGLNDWASSERVFAKVSASSRMSVDGRLGLSRAKRNQKSWAAAIEALQPYVDRPPPPWGRDVGAEALLALADIYSWKGDKKRETDALQRCWSRHPITREAAKAEPRLGALTELPKDVLVSRGDALIDAHRNAQGMAVLEPMLEGLKLPDPLACKAHFSVGKGARKLRQHAKAIATLGPVVKKCKDADLRARALYTLGFSQTMMAPAAAADTYAQLAREYPENGFADDALYYAADGYERRGDGELATNALIELVDRYPNGDFTADALFRLFWIEKEAGRYEQSLVFLEEIEGRQAAAEDTYDVERAQYWRARTYQLLDRPTDALVAFGTLARAHPTTYYGLVAREHVEAIDEDQGRLLDADITPAKEKLDPFPIYAGPLGSDPQFLSAVELLRLGMGEQVPMEVLAIDRTNLPVNSVRLLVHLLSLSGEQRSAHGLARLWLRRDLSGPVTKENRAIWEIAYPQVFRDLVTKHATASDGLDPDLLQALMREESALDPRALSWAGALGLCQLMPATAAEVAGRLKLKYPTTAQLLDPDLNIRLGARYLSDVLLRAKGVKQYALAGYNAGEGSVARWKRDLPDADLDVWVEEIPVQETRGYVKRVLRSFNTYKLLYAPEELPRTVVPTRPQPPKQAPKTG